MKLIRILFQAAVFLVVSMIFSQLLLANTSNTLAAAPISPAASAVKSHLTHLAASAIISKLETGFMGNVVPLVALFLLGRGIWMLIPSRHRAEWSRQPAIQSGIMSAKSFLATARAFRRTVWLWIITPRAESEVDDNGPRVEIPPLRRIPERITIF